MLKLKFGKKTVEVKNELKEMSIDEWMDISKILGGQSPYLTKYYKLLQRLGVDEALIDEMTPADLKKIFSRLKFKSDDDIDLKDEITVGEDIYKFIGFNAKIYTYIESEVTEKNPNWMKIVAYLYKLEGNEMGEHIAQTKKRTDKFSKHLMALDVLPVMQEVTKTINDFIGK